MNSLLSHPSTSCMNTNNVYITGEALGLSQVNSPVITSFQVGDIIYGSNMHTKEVICTSKEGSRHANYPMTEGRGSDEK